MTHVMFRIWLLWGAVTLFANWWFGFNQWLRLWEIVEASTPQVEAFWVGLRGVGHRQLPMILLAFFYRRAVILAVKKTIQFVLFILLETHWRRMFNSALTLPGYYTTKGWRSIQTWRQLHDFLLLRRWFLYLYTASMLTLTTFVFAELILALIRGSLALPPIVVQYQAQLLTFIGAFIAATLAQSILLFVWQRLYCLLPSWVHGFVQHFRWPVFRRLVQLRAWRRAVTATMFSWSSLLFVGTFIICLCLPM